MHIPDGLLNPINPATQTLNVADATVLVATWAITIPFLVFAWRKTKATYSTGFASMLAMMSALVFVVQMLTFPVMGGISVHVLGGTLLAVVLGPYAGMLSMTLVLGMQAVFFADGGLLAFGANTLNMAVIGSLSYFLVKALMGKSGGSKRFAQSLFVATFVSAILTAALTAVEVGVGSAFAGAGGLAVTLPTMLSFYAAEGLVEAALTSLVGVALVASLPHMQHLALKGFSGFALPGATSTPAAVKTSTRPRFSMRKLFLGLAVIMIVFAILVPFASTTPDGLQEVVTNSADQAQQQQPIWNGLMADYSVALANPYISTLVAGFFGVGLVLAATYALSASITHKRKTQTTENISC